MLRTSLTSRTDNKAGYTYPTMHVDNYDNGDN